MKVIAILNQKGGVGKTSTCHHLAGALALMGRRVLLLDADPQSSLTQGLFGPVDARSIDPCETMAAILAGELPFASRVIRTTGLSSIDIVPGSRACTTFNVPDPEWLGRDRQASIRDFLGQVDGDYDLALIDCPPNLHLCSWAALVAADFLVVPLQPENYGAQGISDVTASMAMVQAGPNPDLQLAGFLLTMVAKEAVHAAFEGLLRVAYGDEVFTARIPRAAVYKEAIGALKPISHYKPRSAPAKAIRAVADELLARILSPQSSVLSPQSSVKEVA